VGRDLEVCLHKSGRGALHQTRSPLSSCTADFVACLEIVGGLLLLSGLMTRLIAIPFIIEMIVAITLDESLAVSGNITLAFGAVAA
jgi:uncharacterized membrane protein YphA (DoxX/SURF4 family)